MNYYEILGVNQNADPQEIKKAYKKRSIELHPDRNPSLAAKKAYDKVRQAYNCLSNERKRAAYDLKLSSPKTAYDDMSSFFWNATHEEEIKRAAKSKAFSAKITIEEAFSGCRRFIPGAGKYIDIPPGVIDGSRVKSNDITVMVSIIKHPKFVLDKNNLYATLYIDAIQAMVGIDVIVNHPQGNKIKAKIPAGTQEGQRIRLTGQGLKNQSCGQGDLYISCHIVIPQLTDADQDSIIHLLNSSSAEI